MNEKSDKTIIYATKNIPPSAGDTAKNLPKEGAGIKENSTAKTSVDDGSTATTATNTALTLEKDNSKEITKIDASKSDATQCESKKKSFFSIAKIATVLVVITIIAGGLLGLVNHFTQIDAGEVLQKKLAELYDCQDGFRFIDVDTLEVAATDVAKKGKITTIAIPNDGSKNVIFIAQGNGAYKSTLQIACIILDNKISTLKKYASEETPGLGSKAFEDKYTSQFLGVDISEIESFILTSKGDTKGGIVAVSGATKSSNAVLNAVNISVLYYKNCLDKILGGGAL